jgi:hypothetical protein
MLDKALALLPPEQRSLALTAGGMAALLGGNKLLGAGLFMRGVAGLEANWRARRPRFEGGLPERWRCAARFYEQTHRHPVNRALHMAGIPMIVGGAVGLLTMPSYSPPWALAAGSFATGWALNIVGHAVFEKRRPAFAEDPLSFIAGPIWDLQQLRGALRRDQAAAIA